jgi:DNA processing protein
MPAKFEKLKITDGKYPRLLYEIPDPPKELYFRGALPDKELPTIAVVGTRRASKKGAELAESVARDLVRAGVVVVSGLAMGIDTAAHKGAVKENGKTLAVLGNGIDTIYPAQNEKIAGYILKNGGAIISEYGPGEPSYKGNFIQRNRIISGLSLGVVIIEAPEKSGALTTARFAAEQGREVFVFPGPASDRNYTGSHSLIRDGAILVTNSEQILEDIGIEPTMVNKKKVELDIHEREIVEALESFGTPLRIDKITEATKLDPQTVSAAIARLVIQGAIKEGESGYELANR